MRATFMGIETARRALQAQQLALDTTAHNIANANTRGYSRQRAVQVATSAYPAPGLGVGFGTAGQIGTGVRVATVERVWDGFIESQLRDELHRLGEWQARQEVLSHLELIVLEPSDVGLRRHLDAFWEALQDLHLSPESDAARSVVRQQGIALTETFRHIYQQVEDLQRNLDNNVAVLVDEINSRIQELGMLNQLIRRVANTGKNANDLLDRRDLVLQELAQLTQVSAVEGPGGTVRVSIGGVTVVEEWGQTWLLELRPSSTPGQGAQVYIQGLDVAVPIRSGRLGGLLAMRDERIPGLLASLDELALGLIEAFNAVHREGFDANLQPGGAFFAGTGAKDITLDERILDLEQGLSRIAAGYLNPNDLGAEPSIGNGNNALRLAQLRTAKLFPLNPEDGEQPTMTIGDRWASVVSGLGVDALKARDAVLSAEVVVGHLESRRESITGVNLDEEMTDMIRYQHAYNAAARLVTALDEILETIIHRMGMVGR